MTRKISQLPELAGAPAVSQSMVPVENIRKPLTVLSENNELSRAQMPLKKTCPPLPLGK